MGFRSYRILLLPSGLQTSYYIASAPKIGSCLPMNPTSSKKPDELPGASSLGDTLQALAADAASLDAAIEAAAKRARIEELDGQLAQGWDDHRSAAAWQRERARLLALVEPLEQAQAQLAEGSELLALASEEHDPALLADIRDLLAKARGQLDAVELLSLLATPHAECDTYLDVHFGSGGIESQDWAQMLRRMYLGYGNERGFKVSQIEETTGEAGIKSSTLKIEGANAYGLLRTETGVHRMVRKSPFDSNHRRHTTFASVYVYPVLPESEQVALDPGDLRIDTYRSSGAGGQHVNTTDSAVRITHLPSGIVVQSQSDRSQHKNKATALAMLRSRLEMRRKQEEDARRQQEEKGKDSIAWGSQIRSYVLDQSRVKDLRTGLESSNPRAVLSGQGLHQFIEASLRARL